MSINLRTHVRVFAAQSTKLRPGIFGALDADKDKV